MYRNIPLPRIVKIIQISEKVIHRRLDIRISFRIDMNQICVEILSNLPQ